MIPFEYDASWKHYDPASYNGLDEIEYCYAATECYVPLVKDGRWEMRDSKNEVIIPIVARIAGMRLRNKQKEKRKR